MIKIKKAVIPAAGWGTRFFPMTKALPKEMLPVVDKPVIQYVVEEAIASGCDDILIITGKNKRAIEDHFDSSPELDAYLEMRGNTELLTASRELENLADIHFIRQKEPKGLGDAILCAKQHVGDEPFAVLLGDTICLPDAGQKPCTAQLASIYEVKNRPVIGVEQVSHQKIEDYGIIDGDKIDDRLYSIRHIIEKPAISDAPSDIGIIGRYILTPEIFSHLEKTGPGKFGEVQLSDALNKYQALLGYSPASVRYDVGDMDGWIKTNVRLLLQHPRYGQTLKAELQNTGHR